MPKILKSKYTLVAILMALMAIFSIASTAPSLTKSEKEVVLPLEVPVETSKTSESPKNEPRVIIGKVNIPVEVMKSNKEIQRGLSGRESLSSEKGMLFLFSKAANYRFWMPDMHFPIDIIWIGENKRIIAIHKNVSPEFDPNNPKFYTPPKPVRYVLEVNALFAQKNNIEIGDELIFENVY